MDSETDLPDDKKKLPEKVAHNPVFEYSIPEPGERRATKEEAEYFAAKIVEVSKDGRRSVKETKIRNQRVEQWYLMKMKNTEGFCELGFRSMHQMIESRYPGQVRHYERLIVNAEFQKELLGEYLPDVKSKSIPDGVDENGNKKYAWTTGPFYVNEWVTRPITTLPKEVWSQVWEVAEEIARGKSYPPAASEFLKGKITGEVARQAVYEWKRRNGIAFESDVTMTVEEMEARIKARTVPHSMLQQFKSLNTDQLKDLQKHIRLALSQIAMDRKKVLDLDE